MLLMGATGGCHVDDLHRSVIKLRLKPSGLDGYECSTLIFNFLADSMKKFKDGCGNKVVLEDVRVKVI